MMEKITIKVLGSLVFVIVVAVQLTAQPMQNRRENKRQQLQEYKQKYIKEVLALTDEDAAAFFPVYQAYEEAKKVHRKKLNELKVGFMAKSDEQLSADLDAIVALKEAELQTEKEYLQKFKAVITVRQVAALYYAENQFKKKLLERYGNNN